MLKIQFYRTGAWLLIALASFTFSSCARITDDGPLEENTPGKSNSTGAGGGGVGGGAPAGCISFVDHFDASPASSKKFYADEAVAPTTDLGTFGNPALAVNGVKGSNGATGSTDVYSLRDHTGDTSGELVLRWSSDTVCNGTGTDFVVHENAFYISGQNGEVLIEPAIVSVSIDGTNWVSFHYDYQGKDTNADDIPDDELASPGSGHYGHWQGFAGLFPSFYHEENHNYVDHGVDPFNQGDRATTYAGNLTGAAGGDHFDMDDLPNTTLANQIKQDGFRYIRLTRATSVENPDHPGNNFPLVPNSFDQGGPDIDGVYARYLKPD